MTQPSPTVRGRIWDGLLGFAVRFGVVGLVGYLIDIAVFNALRLGAFGVSGWPASALGASVISTAVAIVFNWAGNRWWAFRRNRRSDVAVEFGQFVAVSLGGMLITVATVWVSHYLLGFTSLLADNIAKNVVGLALGTAFRFVLYRYWVFSDGRLTRIGQTA